MPLDLATIREALAAATNIELRPPATEGEVASFEARLGIALPADYRQFLLDVGDGIFIDDEPWLYSMEAVLQDLAPPRNRPGPRREASNPFLYGDAEAVALREALAAAPGVSVFENRAFMRLQRRGLTEGCISVGYNGGNDFSSLVTVGEQRGIMWRTGEIDHPEMATMYDPNADFRAPLGFVQWFVGWAPLVFGVRMP
jgi:hypothetical protein